MTGAFGVFGETEMTDFEDVVITIEHVDFVFFVDEHHVPE